MSTLDKIILVGKFIMGLISFIATDLIPLIAAF